MNKIAKLFSLALTLLAGCSTVTHLDGEWKVDAFPTEGFRSLAVITLRDDPIERLHFGGMLAEELNARKVKAAPGDAVVPAAMYDKNSDGRPDSDADQDAIQRHVAGAGYDAIITITVRNTEKDRVYVKGTEQTIEKRVYDPLHNAWIKTTETVGQPGYYQDLTRVHIETNLYATSDGRLCWKGATETLNPAGSADLARSYAKRIAAALVEQGIARP
jgi:hypothetical protein